MNQKTDSKSNNPYLCTMERELTPQDLRDHGFDFTPAARVSGADMWQGMAFWTNKELQITLRGNISTARPGCLRLWDSGNLQVNNVRQLENLMEMYGWKRGSSTI